MNNDKKSQLNEQMTASDVYDLLVSRRSNIINMIETASVDVLRDSNSLRVNALQVLIIERDALTGLIIALERSV
jgi:hypothetical protein